MSKKHPEKKPLLLSALTSLGVLMTCSSQAQEKMMEEIVVTAQKRAENIQDVPIAITAFNGQLLDDRSIDTAVDLQLFTPNLSFVGGRAGNSSSEFSIRGVGAAVGGSTGDVGVGVHLNNAPLFINRATQSEFYDMERIEVLRGPQGTLYGRNATGGVINFITNKPAYDFSGEFEAETASYKSRKFKGYVNVPLGDTFAVRLAGSSVTRNGYTDNLATNDDIDGRDLWSTRLSFLFEPNDVFSSTLMWEHFEADSTRDGGSRAMCIHDPGPTVVGSTPVTNAAAQLYLSRGCAQGSIYDDAAYDNFNSVATFGGRYGYLLGLTPGDTFANQPQSTDIRKVSRYMNPEFEVENNFLTLDNSIFLSDELSLNILFGYGEDEQNTRSGSEESEIGFPNIPGLTPGGVFTDFQSGPASGIRTLTTTDNESRNYSAEIRLQSDYDSAFNFNLGAFYYKVDLTNTLFISTNSTSLFALASGLPLYFDTNADPSINNYDGHQYFVTQTPYELDAKAVFGEIYYDINDTLKLTAGLRYTDETKDLDLVPVLLFNPVGANGPGTAGHPPTGAASIQRQTADFDEYTYRLVLDWLPDVSFADQTLMYASLSRGYKAGGFNSPENAADAATFTAYEPEFVNAFEIGTKNTFSNGTQVNLSMFYYDYTDYQLSTIVQFSSRNTNVDAEVFGAELETLFEPIDSLILTANLSWLHTEIKEGSFNDPFNRTQGDPSLSYLVTPETGCVVQTSELEELIVLINANIVPASILANAASGANNDICEGADAAGAPTNTLNGLGIDLVPTAGLPTDLTGNELPQSPEWSYTLGAQYTFTMGAWDAIMRADYSWRDDSFVSPFNGEDYELRDWQNANLSVIFEHPGSGVAIQLFGKNVLNDDDTIVNYGVGGQGLGLGRTLTVLDPRIFGVNIGVLF